MIEDLRYSLSLNSLPVERRDLPSTTVVSHFILDAIPRPEISCQETQASPYYHPKHGNAMSHP
jgi:hypothetical protein